MNYQVIILILSLLTSINSFTQSDTISYINCGGGIPSGWQVFDSTGNDYFWQHTTTGVEAVYNPIIFTEMNSTSNSDGWLMFHSAYYNTDTTGGGLNEMNPILLMNSTLTSNSMDFSSESSVYISFEHWYHTLNNPTWGSLDFAVSNDAINWTTFSMNTGSDSPSTGTQNQIENVNVDISSIAANQVQVWIRFHVNNLAWHFWNIDDIVFLKQLPSASYNSINEDREITIGPNPTMGNLKIDLEKIYNAITVTVYNALGQIVINESFQSTDEINIDIKGQSGVYILEINTEERKFARINVIKK